MEPEKQKKEEFLFRRHCNRAVLATLGKLLFSEFTFFCLFVKRFSEKTVFSYLSDRSDPSDRSFAEVLLHAFFYRKRAFLHESEIVFFIKKVRLKSCVQLLGCTSVRSSLFLLFATAITVYNVAYVGCDSLSQFTIILRERYPCFRETAFILYRNQVTRFDSVFILFIVADTSLNQYHSF